MRHLARFKCIYPIVMKTHSCQYLLVLFSFAMTLAGCHKKNPPVGLASSSSHPESRGISTDAGSSLNMDQVDGPRSDSGTPKVEEQLDFEKARLVLFSIPLSEAASKDCKEAWSRLTPPPGGLDNDHYKYACDLLERYAKAPQLEKLAFWKLCSIRVFYQSPRSIVRSMGESGFSREILEEKMKTTLYSALGKNLEDVTFAEAILEGDLVLRQAIDNEKIRLNVDSDGTPSVRFSYRDLEKELLEIEKSAGWPRSQEQELAYREALRKSLDRRKTFLFSVPIGPSAEKDRNAAWDLLEFRDSLSIFTDEQHGYAKALMVSYSESPAIEKLVIWDLVRTRMEYSRIPGGGIGLSGTAEILLRQEMAKLLFSALGLEKQELFDALTLKARAESNEAESKAGRAEEKIELIYKEQSKVAEQILEQHAGHLP